MDNHWVNAIQFCVRRMGAAAPPAAVWYQGIMYTLPSNAAVKGNALLWNVRAQTARYLYIKNYDREWVAKRKAAAEQKLEGSTLTKQHIEEVIYKIKPFESSLAQLFQKSMIPAPVYKDIADKIEITDVYGYNETAKGDILNEVILDEANILLHNISEGEDKLNEILDKTNATLVEPVEPIKKPSKPEIFGGIFKNWLG